MMKGIWAGGVKGHTQARRTHSGAGFERGGVSCPNSSSGRTFTAYGLLCCGPLSLPGFLSARRGFDMVVRGWIG